MKTHLEYIDKKSAKFWEIEVKNSSTTVRYGRIGTDGQTRTKEHGSPEAAQKEAEKLIAAKKKKGYEKKQQHKGKKQSAKVTKPHKLITEKEAIEKYQLNKLIEGLYGDDCYYYLYEGDLHIDGDFDTYKKLEKEKKEVYGYIITGDLIIDGVLFQPDMDYGETLVVLGNLTARAINKGGAQFYISGNATVKQIIYGFYNHGSLEVGGNVICPVVFADDHYFEIAGKVNGLLISNNGEIIGVKADFDHNDLEQIINPELFHAEGYLESGRVSDYINSDKPILKKGVKKHSSAITKKFGSC